MTEIHATAMPFAHTIASVAELRELYRPPSKLVIDKERTEIDEASARFIARSRFLVVGTHDAAGRADVSPRGGPGGFVRVLDPRRLVIADLGGNNRIDTLQNIVDTGRIALLFVVPGRSETVRVNGAGWVTTDPEILASFAMPRLPTAAIGVQVEATFIHCAKAFRRGVMWEPEAWAELADAPDAADIIACQGLVEAPADVVRGHLAADYDAALAWEAGGD